MFREIPEYFRFVATLCIHDDGKTTTQLNNLISPTVSLPLHKMAVLQM